MFSSKSDDPNSPSKCPYCNKEIGVDKNTYRFQVVDFTAVVKETIKGVQEELLLFLALIVQKS